MYVCMCVCMYVYTVFLHIRHVQIWMYTHIFVHLNTIVSHSIDMICRDLVISHCSHIHTCIHTYIHTYIHTHDRHSNHVVCRNLIIGHLPSQRALSVFQCHERRIIQSAPCFPGCFPSYICVHFPYMCLCFFFIRVRRSPLKRCVLFPYICA